MIRKDKTRDAQAKPRLKWAWPLVALVLVLALGLGAYFLFAGGQSDDARIKDVFNRFQAATKVGDIQGMTACAPPDRYDDSFVLLFDLLKDFRNFTQNGRYDVSGIDYTNDSTMIRSFVQTVGLAYSIRPEDSIEFGVDEGGEWATLHVVQTIVLDGETSRYPATYTMVKQQNKWYIGYAQFIGTEETRVRRLVSRFANALKAGDIEGMRACYIEDELEDGVIPLFGDAGEFRAELQEGGLNIDFTSDSTMLRSFVEALNLDFTIITFQGFYLSEDGQSAEQDVIQSYMNMESGKKESESTHFKLLRHGGKWYLDIEAEENES